MAGADRRPRERSIDDVDRAILDVLAADGRLSHREIARRIGMSPGAASQRVERLEEWGVITGYRAVVDPKPLGYTTEVVIGLQVNQGMTALETMDRLSKIPEVRSVATVTGQWDFLVELRVRDQDHLREVLLGGVWRLPIFRHSETMVVLERVERPPRWAEVLPASR